MLGRRIIGLACSVTFALVCFSCGGGEIASPLKKTEPSESRAVSAKTEISAEAVETLNRMLLVTNGVLAYQAEHWQKLPDASSYSDLVSILAPAYINEVPTTDGWETPFKLVTNRDHGVMRFASAGANKTFDLSDRELMGVSEQSAGKNPDQGFDFVASSDDVFRYPRLGSVATEDMPRLPLKVVGLTVVRFGNRGRYIAVQGVVGNASAARIASIEPNVEVSCTDRPSAKVITRKPERFLGPDSRVRNLEPGELQRFRRIVELDLTTVSNACAITAGLSFAETGGGTPYPHEVLGEQRAYTRAPEGMSSAGAKQGAVVARVNTVKRLLLDELSTASGVQYEINAADPLALDITPLPFEATRKGLWHHFEPNQAEHDWTLDDVQKAVDEATAQITEYLRSLEPGLQAVEWSQFRLRNFAALKALAQRKLQEENSKQ